jgi:type III restriction enzyme
VKQATVSWIIETKGREFEDTDEKAAHMTRWCKEVSDVSEKDWRFLKVSQPLFDDFSRSGARTFSDLVLWGGRQSNLLGS